MLRGHSWEPFHQGPFVTAYLTFFLLLLSFSAVLSKELEHLFFKSNILLAAKMHIGKINLSW